MRANSWCLHRGQTDCIAPGGVASERAALSRRAQSNLGAEVDSRRPAADIPREEDRDALADIIWFIKGAQSIDKDFALDHRHIEALRRYRVTNVDQVVEKARRELGERCDRIINTYQTKIDEL